MGDSQILMVGECILFICLSIWTGREVGYVIDKQNRDIGGKPYLIKVSQKWRWLFRFQNKMYTDKYMILRASVILCFIGYISAVIEVSLLVIALNNNNLKLLSVVPEIYIGSTLAGAFCVMVPNSLRYEYNMRKTYEYDWITDMKEQLTQRSKRRCKVVSRIDDDTYEITLGRFGKKKFRANSEVMVEVGDEKYAIHIYHPIDENKPYWIIKNH